MQLSASIAKDRRFYSMRFLVATAMVFLLASPAIAQTTSDTQCLDLTLLEGQPLGTLWVNSFSTVLSDHAGALTKEQAQILQQAIDFGNSREFNPDSRVSIHAMKGILDDARSSLTRDQLAEILARMGPDSQNMLVDIGVIEPGDVACSCTRGGSGCPSGFPCTVGCVTWGTGAWNGICKRAATPIPQN